MKVVIIGGVAGGASTAARLRRMDENAQIIMIERTGYVSYANCGLPYYIGGTIKDQNALTLQTPESFSERFRIDARVNQEVTAIDTEKKEVTVKHLMDGTEYVESYDKLVISTGAKAIKPAFPGIDLENIYTVRTVEDTLKVRKVVAEKTHKKAVIVGGGFIGIEMAENLTEAGIQVTMVELQNQVMPTLDYEIACHVQNCLRHHGVKLELGKAVESFQVNEDKMNVCLSDGRILDTDMVVLAIGVTPDTALAEKSGIVLGEKGAIITNEYLQTNKDDVYACGDAVLIPHYITGKKALIALAGPANKQGRIIADNISGKKHAYCGSIGSSVLKVFDYTVASTGLSEAMARKNGMDVEVTMTISPAHASYYPNAVPLVFKTVFDKKTGLVLGAQGFGQEGVHKRINVMATAIYGKMDCHELAELDLAYAPAYASAKDQVNIAGFIMENILDGRLEQFHYTDIAQIQANPNAILLDIRSTADYNASTIEGALSIELGTLREHLQELDKNKTIYAFCMSGHNSHTASCILRQHGYKVKSLSGGIKLYQAVNESILAEKPILECGVEAQTTAPITTILEKVENNCTLTPDEIKSVKGLGFLHCKGTNNFNGRIITKNGKVSNQELHVITDAADKYGNGDVTMTTRLTMEVQEIPFENITPFIETVNAGNLLTGGTGSKVRPVVSCKGTTCQYGLIDTFAISEKIHERFYVDYHGIDLPHKFKIAVGGCPNNCVKPNLNDLGIVGQKIMQVNSDKCKNCKKCAVENFCPIKSAKVVNGVIELGENCNHCGRCASQCHFGAINTLSSGYLVYVGGRWGKQIKHGEALSKIFNTEEEVLNVVEKSILLFRDKGISGERFASTIERLGMDEVNRYLIGNELLERKDEILGLNVIGGASC